MNSFGDNNGEKHDDPTTTNSDINSKENVKFIAAPSASDLLCANAPEKKLYWDRSHYDSPGSQIRALAKSSTLYIGNLAFSTRTSHLKALFSSLGPVAKIQLGVDRFKKTACGFAFVVFCKREDALNAVAYLSGTKLDGRVVRVELDAGLKPGRQFGRGVSGGQVRDDRRTTVDPARVGGRSNRNPNGGISANRWQAPQKTSGPSSSGHYGPPAGAKRKRDTDDDMDEQPTKNPRFHDDRNED